MTRIIEHVYQGKGRYKAFVTRGKETRSYRLTFASLNRIQLDLSKDALFVSAVNDRHYRYVFEV
jgi:hypothetical protein